MLYCGNYVKGKQLFNWDVLTYIWLLYNLYKVGLLCKTCWLWVRKKEMWNNQIFFFWIQSVNTAIRLNKKRLATKPILVLRLENIIQPLSHNSYYILCMKFISKCNELWDRGSDYKKYAILIVNFRVASLRNYEQKFTSGEDFKLFSAEVLIRTFGTSKKQTNMDLNYIFIESYSIWNSFQHELLDYIWYKYLGRDFTKEFKYHDKYKVRIQFNTHHELNSC